MVKNNQISASIGLFNITLLVTSNMLGSGIYMLPASLAQNGGMTIIAWLITLIGVLAFALVMAKLSLVIPGGAGPYSYAKKALGDAMGFHTNFIYSIGNWIALVSMPAIVIGYLQNIVPWTITTTDSIIIQVIIIWFFTGLNILGTKFINRFQSISFIIALFPILFVAFGGWFWFDKGIFLNGYNPTHANATSVINNSFNTIMWAFIGVESACVSARLVKNPIRNVPLATILGVIIAAIVYISIYIVMLGIIPADMLSKSNSPLADVLKIMFHSQKIGIIVSIIATLDCIGAMGGWCLVTGQTAQLAASEGLFPKMFAKINKKDMPSVGLITLAIFMSLIVIITASPTAQEQFNKIISMSVLLYLLPYIYSTISLMVIGKRHRINSKYYFIASIACGFMIWSIRMTDFNLIKYAIGIIVIGLICKMFSRKKS